MAGNDRNARSSRRGPRGPRISRGRVAGGTGRQSPSPDAGVERHGLDEADQTIAAADDGRETKFVSWQDLERVADEAADIDAVVRSELEAVGERRAVDDEAFADSVLPPRRRELPGGVFLVVLVAAAIGAAFLVVRSTGEQPRAQARSPISRSSSAVPTTQPPSHSPPVPPKPIAARLSFSAPCWVDAVADGRTVLVGTLTDGSRTIRAKRTLLLTLGNAGGVDLLVNGRRVRTGAAAEVVHLSFALEGGKVTELTS
jgi:hypothetical protein